MKIDRSTKRRPVRPIIISIKELGPVLVGLLIFNRFYERSGPMVLQYMLRYTRYFE